MATIGDSFDHVGGLLRVEMVYAEIIQEEEGFGSGDDKVVYAHGDEVDTHGVVNPGLGGEFDFGADTIGACNEDGVFVVAFEELFVVVEAEETCESTMLFDDARAISAFHVPPNHGDHLIAGFNVDTALGVRHGFGVRHVASLAELRKVASKWGTSFRTCFVGVKGGCIAVCVQVE